MALFDNIKSESFYNKKNRQKDINQSQAVRKVLSTDPDSYKKPSNPVSEQAKQKLSTSARYKAVFSQGKLFSNNIANLSLDEMYYIFDDTTVDKYLKLYGNNAENAIKADEGYRPISKNLPKYLIGGGEGDLIPMDGIDLKNLYNSEAKIAEY